MPFLDLLRALAANFIVLHHLAYHGSLADLVEHALPAWLDAVLGRAGMAVQVFLVLGGFAAARGLARAEVTSLRDVVRGSGRRYLRLVRPYAVALLLAVAANETARALMPHPAISSPATVVQFLAHVLFLQDLLGMEALTTGVWYLAIDFQLGVLTLLLAWVAHRSGAPLRVLLAALSLAALLVFNRDDGLEHWAVYFFASYFLGMLAQWARAGTLAAPWAWVGVAALVTAGWGDERPRLLVAAVTGASILVLGGWDWGGGRVVRFVAKISYSLFLVHFPVCLVVYALAAGHGEVTPEQSLGVMAVAYGLSLVVAALFHHAVEAPLLARRRHPAPARELVGEPSLG